MTPVVALVGRPNVGKSTLFNVLTRTRRALVADVPGLTRDRQYGTAFVRGRELIVVDTGGLTEADAPLETQMAHQTGIAIEQADAVLVLVDVRDGLTPDDAAVIERLRRSGKPFRIVGNKTDGLDPDVALAEFHGLAAEPPLAIAAAHNRGIAALGQALEAMLPAPPVEPAAGATRAEEGRIRIAVIGRPNVGKSTLVNRLLGEERMLALDEPGTTRDSVFVDFERDGVGFTLIDTAGLRRRRRVTEAIEKFSAIKTLEAIRAAHVVILVLDAHQGIAEQDQHVVGHVLDAGRALVVAVNKWDGLERDERQWVRATHDRRFGFVDFAETHYISALHGTGVGKLMQAAKRAHDAATRRLPTPELTRILENAVEAHAPPMVGGGRVKLRYAHQSGSNPPSILVHGSRTERLPGSYRRYLENTFREAFQLRGTPVRIELKSGDNPYAGRKRAAKKKGPSRKKTGRKKAARSRR
ncbi:MAG: ribosome biogenesis GTPase Der [Halofilum sp. (in: g-proteobacteria)]|nr:ribosome biogenesis GTPase Der [Halofilum sp. (in: g-proteobacteria)]